MALAESSDFYTFTGLTLPEDRVDFLLAISSGSVQTYCGWHIAPSVTETVTVDGSGATILALPTLKLTAVTAVTEEDEPVDLDDMEWSTVGILTRSSPWTKRLRGIAASITHGHAVTPPEIMGIVLMAAVRASTSPTGVVREQVGPFSVTHSQTGPNQAGGVVLLPHEEKVLERYKISNAA